MPTNTHTRKYIKATVEIKRGGIDTVHYDYATGKMIVWFTSGTAYEHDGVTQGVFTDLVTTAHSPREYYRMNVYKKFGRRRVL